MPVYPSATNTWIPSWDATGQVIGFCRSAKNFRINDYLSFRPAKKMVGVYLKYDSPHFVRVPTDEEFIWPDGGERPSGNNNTMGFDFVEYATQRRDFPVTLGNLTAQQADWPIMAAHAQMVMSQAMTSLTRRTITVLEATGNWGTHFGTATALGGGLWLGSTVANGFIRKTIDQVVVNILTDTNGLVTPDELWMIVAPAGAKSIAEAPETIDYIKQSPFAMAQVKGDVPSRNKLFSLPDQVWGVNLMVETATVEPSRKGAASTRAFVKNSNSAVILTKQQMGEADFVGDHNTLPNMSTFQVFYYGETGDTDGKGAGLCVVETWDDVRNKRQETHVVQNTIEKLVSSESGYLITNINS